MKNIVIHVLRGVSYIAFPIGVALFAFFLISWNELDFTTFRNILINISAILLFFIPPIIILFLHSSIKHPNEGFLLNTTQAKTGNIWFDRSYLLVVITLFAFGVSLLFCGFMYLIFFGFVLGG